MLTVGPFEFTMEDARNTLRDAPEILELMAEGRPGVIDHLQTHLSRLLEGIDAVKSGDDVIVDGGQIRGRRIGAQVVTAEDRQHLVE